MKKFLLIPLLILLVTTGCKKEPIPGNASPQPIVPPPPAPILPPPAGVNNAPKAFAGDSKFVALPADSCPLYGGSSGNNIESYSWKYISGPASPIIEKPQSIITNVYNLKKGIYEFELTVTNKAGLWGKDTVTVTVYEVATHTKEIILKDLRWICPMGCVLEVPYFDSYVPVGIFFRVYIKRDNSIEWVEVKHTDQSPPTEKYVFGLYKNKFWIYSGAEDVDTPDVKITF